jgi:hypothetical protein
MRNCFGSEWPPYIGNYSSLYDGVHGIASTLQLVEKLHRIRNHYDCRIHAKDQHGHGLDAKSSSSSVVLLVVRTIMLYCAFVLKLHRSGVEKVEASSFCISQLPAGWFQGCEFPNQFHHLVVVGR